MKIILKEDNEIHAEYIKELLIKLQIKLNLHFDITITNDLNEIINYNRQVFEIVNILDIMDDETNEQTGITIATQIRHYNPNAYIIFLTAFDYFIKEAVNTNIEPLAYISKKDKNIEEQLQNALSKITEKDSRFQTEEKMIFTDENSDTLYISTNDIYMIQTSTLRQKYIQVDTGDKTYLCRGRISDYENISKDIVQCHKSILVNKRKIFKIRKGNSPKSKVIEFDNKLNKKFSRCTLSIKYKKNLM
jgi:two-component system LytT family response regulator